jgi:hypothetical protein
LRFFKEKRGEAPEKLLVVAEDIRGLQRLPFRVGEGEAGFIRGDQKEERVLIPIGKIGKLLTKKTGISLYEGNERAGQKRSRKASPIRENERSKSVNEPQTKEEPKGGRSVS